MYKVAIFCSALLATVSAYGNGGALRSSAGGYGGSAALFNAAAVAPYGGGAATLSAAAPQLVHAAVQTRHQVQYRDVPSTGSVQPTSIEIGSYQMPVTLMFRSASSLLNVQQAHNGAVGSSQESVSEDEPHFLKHYVNKPIIQELREVITPYRRITQEIQPVQEEILTVVAKGEPRLNGYAAPAAVPQKLSTFKAAPAPAATFAAKSGY